jgi:hypothetical protein
MRRGMSHQTRGLRFAGMTALLGVLLLLSARASIAAPFVPISDAQVLERLPLRANDGAAVELRTLRQKLAADPNNVQLAASLAQRYIEIGRQDADPRFFGYAQASLAPWWDKPSAPLAVRLMRATLLQSTHRFAASIEDLDAILSAVPEHPQALLTRATVHQVRGDFALAKRDCAALGELGDALVSAACMSAARGASGELRASYDGLKRARTQADDASLGAWVETQLAEMALRLGDAAVAEEHFRAALKGDAQDAYTLAAYADFLLDQSRAREVLALLQDFTRADALLLRYALAQKTQGSAQAEHNIAALNARFEAARRRGERVHLREEARFNLQLLNAPAQALMLAQQNWEVQKEPADARILLEAALAAKDKQAAQPLLAWLAQNKLEDAMLDKLRGLIEVL